MKINQKRKQAKFVKWMGPILDCLREIGGSGKPKEVSEWIADKYKIPNAKREEILKSGVPKFSNQVAWARAYLVWEGLLESSKRGVWILTEKGTKTSITEQDGRKLFKKWVEIHANARKEKNDSKIISKEIEIPENISPEQSDYKEELLNIMKRITPEGFEKLCRRLLLESGFEKVTVTGKSHDGGIDGIGILQINPFVSFKVLFQCKRYKGAVARAQVGDFRNAMLGRADKGIIITTGTFSAESIKEADRDGAPPVELVDGEKLVEMLERIELGLKNPRTVYDVDHSFFAQYFNNDNS